MTKSRPASGDCHETPISAGSLNPSEGLTNVQIGNVLGVTDQTTRKWRNRLSRHRLDGLYDEPHSVRPRCIDDDAAAEVVRKPLEEKPRDAIQWNTCSVGQATG